MVFLLKTFEEDLAVIGLVLLPSKEIFGLGRCRVRYLSYQDAEYADILKVDRIRHSSSTNLIHGGLMTQFTQFL